MKKHNESFNTALNEQLGLLYNKVGNEHNNNGEPCNYLDIIALIDDHIDPQIIGNRLLSPIFRKTLISKFKAHYEHVDTPEFTEHIDTIKLRSEVDRLNNENIILRTLYLEKSNLVKTQAKRLLDLEVKSRMHNLSDVPF